MRVCSLMPSEGQADLPAPHGGAGNAASSGSQAGTWALWWVPGHQVCLWPTAPAPSGDSWQFSGQLRLRGQDRGVGVSLAACPSSTIRLWLWRVFAF